ncbi:MAG: DNA polymerase III subunit gamma/tau [Candidatus Eisenbacteria bacterium]
MSYRVLARKWRPSTFEQVVGQAHVTKTLANAIESDRVGHAYLFSGPRGVGKTTTARLFAKALNCPNAKGAVPCNKCSVCEEITNGISLDVIEIDAASNRGIDEIRNLRENVKYAPASGKFKIYVVDEVHMLTEAASNALLKTLEEPPPHVKFVLATTAPLKLTETILSRCQRFEFVRIPTKEILGRLKLICSTEGFPVGEEVLVLVSRRANGSLRDAESMLDQLVSAGLQEAGEEAVTELLGLSGAEGFFKIIDAIKARNAKVALEALGELFDKGANLDEFSDGLMDHLRNLLLIKIHPDLAALVEASSGHVKLYEEQSARFSEGDLLRMISLASRAAVAVRRSALPRLHVEMAIIEMTYLDSTVELKDLLEKLARLEATFSGTTSRGPGQAVSVDPGGSAGQGGGADGLGALVGGAGANADTGGHRADTSGRGADTGSHDASAPARGPDTRAGGAEAQAPEKEPEQEAAHAGTAEPELKPSHAETPAVTTEQLQMWGEVVDRMNRRKKTLGVWLRAAHFRGVSKGKIHLGFGEDKAFEQSRVEDKTNKKVLQEEVAAVFKASLGVSCSGTDARASAAAGVKPVAPNGPENGTVLGPGNGAEGPTSTEGDSQNNTRPESLKEIIEFFNGEIVDE